MKRLANSHTDWLWSSLVVLILAGLLGCNTAPTGTGITTNYRLEGAYVQLIDQDDAHAVATLKRNDSTLAVGSVRLDNDALAFFASYFEIDSAYQAVVRPAASLAGDDLYLVVGDGSRFVDSLPFSTVDTFSITDQIDPANHQLQGAGQVSLAWTAAANASGYVIAAVKAEDAYTGKGYSAPAATVGTSGTIPPEAFLDPISQNPDTGLYNIYVYAYSGQPDSALAAKFLPTTWPRPDTDNIARTNFSGRFGTVTVTHMDTIRVVTQSF
jgi:hypothetical protein